MKTIISFDDEVLELPQHCAFACDPDTGNCVVTAINDSDSVKHCRTNVNNLEYRVKEEESEDGLFVRFTFSIPSRSVIRVRVS